MMIDINRSSDLKKAVAMLMALPLLPADQMPDGLEIVRARAQTTNVLDGRLQEVFDRLEFHWFGIIGCDIISVYKKPTRTNNGLESSFRELNANFDFAHPSCWHLLGALYVLNLSTLSVFAVFIFYNYFIHFENCFHLQI